MDLEAEIEELQRLISTLEQHYISKLETMEARIQKNNKLYHELRERVEKLEEL